MDALLKERMLDFQQTSIPAYIKRDAAVTHVKDMVISIMDFLLGIDPVFKHAHGHKGVSTSPNPRHP